MRFHDYQLSGYEVTENGRSIKFHLTYDYPGQQALQSNIRFGNVALYNFVHTSNALITDIIEIAIPEILAEHRSQVVEWNGTYAVSHMGRDIDEYSAYLQTEGFKAWKIESAVGFYGFVIAGSISSEI